MLAAASAGFASVDVLVNNAGVGLQRCLHTLAMDEIKHVIRVDLMTPAALWRR